MDKGIIESIKAQYPNEEIHLIQSLEDGLEIAVRGAPPAVWAKFNGLSRDFADAGKRSQADEILVRGSMVWPNHEEFHAQLEQRRLLGFYRSASPEVQKISGAKESLKVSKL